MERHRIHELFPEKVLEEIVRIDKDPEFTDNNMRANEILFLLKAHGFTEIGPGTNRLCVRNVDYVYKIALDSCGIRDNWDEFRLSPQLQPYVTKTYECNGIVAVAEYVNLMSKKEFIDSKANIRAILEVITEDWLIIDMGTISKNFANFGYRPNGSIVILDYSYMYPIDRKIMHCMKCGALLKWNPDYSVLNCTRCGRSHNPVDIRDRMWKDEASFIPRDRDDGKDLIIEL